MLEESVRLDAYGICCRITGYSGLNVQFGIVRSELNGRIKLKPLMPTHILLPVLLLLASSCVAVEADSGPAPDVKAIHHLVEQYLQAVDKVDLTLLSQNLVSFIRRVETQIYGKKAGRWRLVHVHFSEERQPIS